MTDELEEQFDRIIQDALKQANAIICPLEDYQESLRGWRDEIATAIQADGGTL